LLLVFFLCVSVSKFCYSSLFHRLPSLTLSLSYSISFSNFFLLGYSFCLFPCFCPTLSFLPWLFHVYICSGYSCDAEDQGWPKNSASVLQAPYPAGWNRESLVLYTKKATATSCFTHHIIPTQSNSTEVLVVLLLSLLLPSTIVLGPTRSVLFLHFFWLSLAFLSTFVENNVIMYYKHQEHQS